jgi:acyl transferase domain-containing protein
VILKPLDQALKDNDVIRSVIVASGVNQDGKTPGITMPNGAAQGLTLSLTVITVVD